MCPGGTLPARSPWGTKLIPALRFASSIVIKGADAAGVGPAVFSSLAVASELPSGTLTAVTIAGADLERCPAAVWPHCLPAGRPPHTLVAIAARGHRR